MPRELGPTGLRVVIIDDHAISRAACRALLRTEGVDVVADVPADERAVDTVAQLRPQLVVVDVSPHDGCGMAIARRIEAMAHGPRVVLTSSADLTQFDSSLDGYQFVAKADICSDALTTEQDECHPAPASAWSRNPRWIAFAKQRKHSR